MLIGNRWVENAYLKILNTNGLVGGVLTVLPGHIITGLTEKGVLVGLNVSGGSNARSVIDVSVFVDGASLHQGHFRCFEDPTVWFAGNQQPTTMQMPPLDIPTDSTVELAVLLNAGAAVDLSFDLFMIAYEIKDFEQAVQPVCYIEDVVGRQRGTG